MRLKSLTVATVLFACPLIAQASNAGTVNCADLLLWMAGGIPEQRIARLVANRGIAFQVDAQIVGSLQSAGATSLFIRGLRLAQTGNFGGKCPTQIVQATAFAQQHRYDEAEVILRKLLADNPKSADLHFVMGYVRQQQNDDSEAFDEYSDSKKVRPGFPEVHNALALIFFRSNDGENTIAEARTALSIDPQNAEGHRYLGLGLMATDKCGEAIHAFKESLARDGHNAETYQDMGQAQIALGDLAAAAAAYRHALRLNPGSVQARKNLALVLRNLSRQTTVVAESR